MACLRKNPLTVGRIAHQVVDHVHFHVQLNALIISSWHFHF